MDDIHTSFDYGYDPDTSESCPTVILPPPAPLPRQATVTPAWLPPVGNQTTPSCFVWSTIYGLATFNAAKKGNYTPSAPALQASPFYAYIKIMEQYRMPLGVCTGGQISWCFDFLEANVGAPNLEQAPVPMPRVGHGDCQAAWSIYGNSALASDGAFSVGGSSQFGIRDAAGLDALRQLITRNIPMVYGTSLYTDFPYYGRPSASAIVPPVPYVGNGIILTMANGQRAGHCMLIIGYDDDLGAVLLQNSFGPDWGTEWNGRHGYVWMAYDTFQTLAQGSACFIDEG